MFAKSLILATLATLALAAPPTPVQHIAARQSSAAAGGLSSLLGGTGGAGGLVSPTNMAILRWKCLDCSSRIRILRDLKSWNAPSPE